MQTLGSSKITKTAFVLVYGSFENLCLLLQVKGSYKLGEELKKKPVKKAVKKAPATPKVKGEKKEKKPKTPKVKGEKKPKTPKVLTYASPI